MRQARESGLATSPLSRRLQHFDGLGSLAAFLAADKTQERIKKNIREVYTERGKKEEGDGDAFSLGDGGSEDGNEMYQPGRSRNRSAG